MPLYTQFRLRDVMIFVFRKSTSKLLMDLYKVLEFNGLPCFIKSKKSLTKFSRETKDFFPN